MGSRFRGCGMCALGAGAGCLVGIVAAVAAIYWLARHFLLIPLAVSRQPELPPSAPLARLLPASVDDFALAKRLKKAGALGLSRQGFHGRYIRREERVDLYVYPISGPGEWDPMTSKVRRHLREGLEWRAGRGRSRSWAIFRRPAEAGAIWFQRRWAFAVISPSQKARDAFLQAYCQP